MADRSSNNRPLKPTLASARAARSPLTPRVAATPTPPSRPTLTNTSSTVGVPPRVTPRVRRDQTPSDGNVTPRSSARKSRVDSSNTTPTQENTASMHGPQTIGAVAMAGVSSIRLGRAQSQVSMNGGSRTQSPPLSTSIGRLDIGKVHETVDSRFFHASDAPKQRSVSKRPDAEKPTFFYADGKEEERPRLSPETRSPVLSAASENRQLGPRTQQSLANAAHMSKSPPMLSPALSGISTLSNASPYFAAAIGQQLPRSPSPSKENLHLSYRKGASQIFGARPTPRTSVETLWEERNSKAETPTAHQAHGKSPSLSSIDSGSTPESKRRSLTIDHTPSPLSHELNSATMPSLAKPPNGIRTIDTSVEPQSPDVRSGVDAALFSPTRSISDLAADARRERKVLDLEISNSSLLAINTSLERELRKQKAELKRFRRLSRAGRLSYASTDRGTRFSDGLSVMGEDDDEGSEQEFGMPYEFDDLSEDDETESLMSGGDSLSPYTLNLEQDRLAKDEKRLRVDLEKHKELLVQSQMMNQSLKRCMFATESMIKDGRKALDYQVRVADVKIGGRVLSGHEDEDECREGIEVEDETLHGDVAAEDFLKVWQGVGRPYSESSEGGDRDSGIEADRPPPGVETQNLDSGRPPEAG
ncbi:hypothetical protein EJ03DRAFT_373194 [Teratosphaeria nubilosa]|uniref:Uncharacterized protein n=1 Tax=Teratosphaeria nubilosa TaxID=161662 RepID=A0A6G1LET3_9PEZI|nr:hypothetical protein EJ03DRAFT_373194 [Teratosphaeria nubilosa]